MRKLSHLKKNESSFEK